MRKADQIRAPVDLYNTSYDNFSDRVQAEVRVETYGQDLGQSSWMTGDELLLFIRRYFFLPPGANEKLIREAGFELVRTDDVTKSDAIIAKRWPAARARREKDLARIEGKANFQGLQEFLWRVHVVSVEGRLCRYAYLARKPKPLRSHSSVGKANAARLQVKPLS